MVNPTAGLLNDRFLRSRFLDRGCSGLPFLSEAGLDENECEDTEGGAAATTEYRCSRTTSDGETRLFVLLLRPRCPELGKRCKMQHFFCSKS